MKHNLYWDCEDGENCYKDYVLPNWEIFNECFIPTKIKITDIDGLVEHKGWFLFIEVKQNTKKIPDGQRILFEQLTRITKRITVLLLYVQGTCNEMDIREYAMFQKGEMIRGWTSTNTEKIEGMITRWFKKIRQGEQT